jgi:FG-GAP repeat/Dockerin type I domain/FG-GAP-like repeat
MTALRLITFLIMGIFTVLPVVSLYAQCPATYTSEGAAADDHYGEAIAIIGDYNNDGFDDFAVGTPENDESHLQAGKVDIFDGRLGSLMFTILGEEANDRFGVSVSGGEDVNGDGFDDILIGAHEWGPNDEGRVYIFFGETSPSNADASVADIIIHCTDTETDFGGHVCMTSDHILIGAVWADAERGQVFIFQHSDLSTPGLYYDTDAYAVYAGESEGDYFGSSLAGIKRNAVLEVDSIFIGAMHSDYGGLDAGKVYEIVGLSPGIHSASSIAITFTGEDSGGRFGASIAGAGFLNEDDIEDIIIGAPLYSQAYIFYSVPSTSNLAEDADLILGGTGGSDWFGHSISSAGDFNFDGVGDVVVGAHWDDAGTGKMYVFSGDDGEELFSVEGETAESRLGRSVAGGSDLTGDGLGDVVVGAIGFSGTAGTNCGKAYVYQGLSESRFCGLIGTDSVEHYGVSVSGAGDVNNDGYDDLIVGAMGYYYSTGMAIVYSGLDGTYLYGFTGDDPYDFFGFSVSGAGDVNQDGYADVVVGAYQGASNNYGYVHVYSGLDASTLHTFGGDSSGVVLGLSVSGAGDVNKDGYADIIAGAPGYNSGTGRTYVYSGHDGTTLHTFDGENEFDQFGFSVSGAGDVNKDGYADLIVGTYNTNRAYVYSGLDGSSLYTFDGNPGDRLGESVSDAGDVNNDGYADLIVGAKGHNGSKGGAYVYSGLDGNLLHTFNGDNSDYRLGYSVSSAGDINDDCFDDLIVGSLGGNNLKIFSGQDGSLMHEMSGQEAFGRSVSGAGDVNNDGRTAVIVGTNYDNTGAYEAGRAFVYVLGTTDIPVCYTCGDANSDQNVNVSDAVWIINYVFVGGDPPDPLDSGDANCDGTSNVSDAVWIINYVFVGGNEPCDSDGDSIPDC